MATTYKIYHNDDTDGVAYMDLPISGRITEVHFACALVAGAGGIGQIHPELSRQAVNQVTVNNPRGVIASCAVVTAAASQGVAVNVSSFPNEPVKSGERLYLNCLGSASNFSSGNFNCFVTIQ